MRKLRRDYDGPEYSQRACAWAAERAVPLADALAKLGLWPATGETPTLDPGLIAEGEERAARSPVRMGGAGDINLIYAAVRFSGAERVVETGIAYGWSSLAILAGLDGREYAKLVSVDMPYPKRNNEAFVGIVVPERLRGAWQIVREPDRRGLEKALRLVGGTVDLCHYDSDKSWWGRKYGFPLLWEALRPGGIFISDDIQDNMAFAEFVAARGLHFAVTDFEGKYVGIVRKGSNEECSRPCAA
jgi:predicted O-methyltransferase YrrM